MVEAEYFANVVVEPHQQFTYVALYQLISATGREHTSQGQPTSSELTPGSHPETSDPAAMRRYTETFAYDAVGNLLTHQHVATGGNWARRYVYATGGNRLLETSAPGDAPEGPYSHAYEYDPHGNMTAMPHLAAIDWDALDRMQHADLGGGGDVYFQYDAPFNDSTVLGGGANSDATRPCLARACRRNACEHELQGSDLRKFCSMQYPDLSPYVHRPRNALRPSLSVGWLDETPDYVRGPVDEDVPALLWEYCRRSVAVIRGYVGCKICGTVRVRETYQDEVLMLGGGEIRVFAPDVIFAAPDLIFHYITKHGYQPPDAFVGALLGLPMPWTGKYAKLLGDAVP